MIQTAIVVQSVGILRLETDEMSTQVESDVDVRMTEEDDLLQFQVSSVKFIVFQAPVMTWNVTL